MGQREFPCCPLSEPPDRTQNILIWTKPGSVHLYARKRTTDIHWEGLRTVRLVRVGNWASANALGCCTGEHLGASFSKANHDIKEYMP